MVVVSDIFYKVLGAPIQSEVLSSLSVHHYCFFIICYNIFLIQTCCSKTLKFSCTRWNRHIFIVRMKMNKNEEQSRTGPFILAREQKPLIQGFKQVLEWSDLSLQFVNPKLVGVFPGTKCTECSLTVIQFTLILTLHNLFFPASLLPHTFHIDVSQLLKAIMTFDQSFPLWFYFLLLFEGSGCVPS